MTSRVLPMAEWPKLRDMWPLIDRIRPDSLTVVVIEDGDQIVGCWGVVLVAHAEGIWIRPDHRARGVVLRRLWRAFQALAGAPSAVITGAADASVASLLERTGAVALPPQYVLPLTRKV